MEPIDRPQELREGQVIGADDDAATFVLVPEGDPLLGGRTSYDNEPLMKQDQLAEVQVHRQRARFLGCERTSHGNASSLPHETKQNC